MHVPRATRANIRQLLASGGEDPVLYLAAGPDDDGGPLQLDVWVSAYVNHSKVVVHRHEVIDELGDDPEPGAIDHYLAGLQQTVHEVASTLA